MSMENSVKTCDFFLGWGIWFLNVFGDEPIKWPIAKKKKKTFKNMYALECTTTNSAN
jgi:hypothetical protein